jgi:hypothetical protein
MKYTRGCLMIYICWGTWHLSNSGSFLHSSCTRKALTSYSIVFYRHWMFIADVGVSPLWAAPTCTYPAWSARRTMLNLALCSLIIEHPSKMEVRAKAARWESFWEYAWCQRRSALDAGVTIHIYRWYILVLYMWQINRRARWYCSTWELIDLQLVISRYLKF